MPSLESFHNCSFSGRKERATRFTQVGVFSNALEIRPYSKPEESHNHSLKERERFFFHSSDAMDGLEEFLAPTQQSQFLKTVTFCDMDNCHLIFFNVTQCLFKMSFLYWSVLYNPSNFFKASKRSLLSHLLTTRSNCHTYMLPGINSRACQILTIEMTKYDNQWKFASNNIHVYVPLQVTRSLGFLYLKKKKKKKRASKLKWQFFYQLKALESNCEE